MANCEILRLGIVDHLRRRFARFKLCAGPCRSSVSAKQHSVWNLLAKLTKEQSRQRRVQHAGKTDEIFKVGISGKQKAVE
jgi:hypothetical protein